MGSLARQGGEQSLWIFFGAVWPLGVMFAATFLLMWIFTLPGVNATMFDRYLPFSCPLNTFVTDAVR
ncbi:hypothetical protein, partial [Escherichia coli]|uniref:hypothetical protein n=1 Tax=Escherichia coli TaxID=562 RepID=UPI001A90049F